MLSELTIHDYRALAHPLSQIEAADEFHEHITAYVQDLWIEMYTDAPPEEEDIEAAVSPLAMLDLLRRCNLRFELAEKKSYGGDPPVYDGYWQLRYKGRPLDALFHGLAYDVMDRAGIDPRAFEHGLQHTNVVFIPDPEGYAAIAHQLLLDALDKQEDIEERREELEQKAEALTRDQVRVPDVRRPPSGEGPREKGRAMADRIVIALRGSPAGLSIDEIARKIRHKNTASVTATLHQMTTLGKPKRIVGWIQKMPNGRYRHTDPTDPMS